MDLIERRKRWISVVGPEGEEEDSPAEEKDGDERAAAVGPWDFNIEKDDDKKAGSKNGERKPDRNGSSKKSKKSNEKDKPAASTDKGDVSTRPSALTSVIYPVLSKLLKTNTDEEVISALAQLKIAFDNAEKAQPGITHTMIAQIIETLKR